MGLKEQNGKTAEEWFNLGFQAKNPEKEVEYYTKALDIDPKYALAWNNKGYVLCKLGKYEAAIDCYDKALEIGTNRVVVWGNKGNALDDLGKYEAALDCYDKVLDIDPEDAVAWNNKGYVLRKLGKYEAAIDCYDKTLEIDPKDAAASSNKGWALGKLGKYEAAIDCFDKALEIKPTYEAARKGKEDAEHQIKQTVIDRRDKVPKIDPKYASAWFNKGIAPHKLGKYEAAIGCYDKALEIDPKYADAWFNKGIALGKLGKYEAAIDCYDKTLEIDPKDAAASSNKGWALGKLGKYEAAIDCYDKVLEIDPKDAAVWFNKGIALAKLGKYEEAIDSYDTAVKIDPKNADAWSNKGYALRNVGKYEAAILCYDKALDIDPNHELATKGKENELNSQTKSAESAIDDAKRLACQVTEAEEVLKQARSALSAGNYREGITIAKNDIEQSKRLRASARPEITLHLTKHNFRPNYWEKVDIIAKNTGTAHGKAISLSFSKEVEVKGLKELNLNTGDEQRLSIMLKPSDVGEIPLEVDIKYQDLDGKAYDTKSEFILSVGEAETIKDKEEREEEIRPADFTPRPTTPSTFPPELESKYRDVKYLSKGGFARVFRAKRVSDGRTVALKVPLSLDEATGRSFLKEIKAWEELRHENIIQLYDVNIMPIPYFEMEDADKGNLEGLRKPVEAEEVARIIFEILEGLKYAHDKGIIHRDLKPQNVLLTGDLTPKISDWGLSKVMAESKSSSITGFSPLYAAPEQVAPKQFGRPDPRTDNYQVGVIFYELVTGRLPFEGDSIMEISSAIVGEEPDLPSEINPEAKDVEPIIMKCLQKRKEDRYQSAAELQRALFEYLKVQLTESLKKSSSSGDLTKSRLFCAKLVLVATKHGDYTEMLEHLSALKNYAKEEDKAHIENVIQGIYNRQKKGIEAGEEEHIREIEILTKRVQMK